MFRKISDLQYTCSHTISSKCYAVCKSETNHAVPIIITLDGAETETGDLLTVRVRDKLLDTILECHADTTVRFFLHTDVTLAVFVDQHAHL